MIRLDLEPSPTAGEQFAFELLVDLSRLLPVLPGRDEGAPVRLVDTLPGGTQITGEAGEIRIARIALQRVLDLAGAAAEQGSTARDRHGRVPARLNPSVQAGTERQLPVQHLAEALLAAVRIAAGNRPVYRVGGWPGGSSWAAAVTHDLDIVTGWPVFAGMRWVELLGRGQATRALAAAGAAVSALGRDPVLRGVETILRLEGDAGIRATWFVLAGNPTLASWRRGDVTYRLEGPAARRIVDRILAAGHEIGLHGSFETCRRPERMMEERERVGRVTGSPPEGVRQHFLRLEPGVTPRGAAQAGFRYDASYGFADRNGFRLGLADVVPLWHNATQAPLPLLEAPLVWMDRTHSKYQREEDPQRWVDEALALAETCRQAGGLWVGLWHPNVLPPFGFPGVQPALERLFRELVARQPYVASLREIVAWREARRDLRGRSGPGGAVELVSDRPGDWHVTLEELQSGRVTRHPWPRVGNG